MKIKNEWWRHVWIYPPNDVWKTPKSISLIEQIDWIINDSTINNPSRCYTIYSIDVFVNIAVDATKLRLSDP